MTVQRAGETVAPGVSLKCTAKAGRVESRLTVNVSMSVPDDTSLMRISVAWLKCRARSSPSTHASSISHSMFFGSSLIHDASSNKSMGT